MYIYISIYILYIYIYIYIYVYIYIYIYIIYIYIYIHISIGEFGLVLAHFCIAVYILDMTSCESFLLAKNELSKLKQLAVITLL